MVDHAATADSILIRLGSHDPDNEVHVWLVSRQLIFGIFLVKEETLKTKIQLRFSPFREMTMSSSDMGLTSTGL